MFCFFANFFIINYLFNDSKLNYIDIRRRSSEILATLLCAGSAAAVAAQIYYALAFNRIERCDVTFSSLYYALAFNRIIERCDVMMFSSITVTGFK